MSYRPKGGEEIDVVKGNRALEEKAYHEAPTSTSPGEWRMVSVSVDFVNLSFVRVK